MRSKKFYCRGKLYMLDKMELTTQATSGKLWHEHFDIIWNIISLNRVLYWLENNSKNLYDIYES